MHTTFEARHLHCNTQSPERCNTNGTTRSDPHSNSPAKGTRDPCHSSLRAALSPLQRIHRDHFNSLSKSSTEAPFFREVGSV
jgi:hypothetical protein